MSGLFITPLDELSVLRFRGPEALRFLQGQLSNDVELLRERPALLAGLHDPQGRVLALLRLFALEPDDILAVLPRELQAPVQQRLAKVILRTKVTIEPADDQWRACGLCGVDAEAAARLRLAMPLAADPPRLLVVLPRHETLPEGELLSREEWNALDVADGLPEVHAGTAGVFVSQMLNLDLLDAISFRKGCYTGQEIIARAHWRGRVKRRMQRFATEDTRRLEPGQKLTLTDERRVQVVRVSRLGKAGSEFLAVAPLTADAAPEAPEPGTPAEAQEDRLLAVQLALPYALEPKDA